MSLGRRAFNMLRGYVNQEWERIQGLDRASALEELDSPSHEVSKDKPSSEVDVPEEELTAVARRVLGVADQADFETIRKAFERLSRRSDPSQFPSGSEEQSQAAKILARVNWAYRVLTADVSDVEKRFRSLEIEDSSPEGGTSGT